MKSQQEGAVAATSPKPRKSLVESKELAEKQQKLTRDPQIFGTQLIIVDCNAPPAGLGVPAEGSLDFSSRAIQTNS